jgi:hypothetical protein
MARTINSPGIQITETDLSQYQNIAGGTNIFVAGFAPQGPTDEVLLMTSSSEFESIYGMPTTPAEKYFYYSVKECLNSTGSVVTTRLPYGSGSGAIFSNQYSALLYPVASGLDGGFSIGRPTHITLTNEQYNNLILNNFTWGNITTGSGAPTVTTYVAASTITTTTTNSAAAIAAVRAADPTPDTYSLSINGSAISINFQVTLSSITYPSTVANYNLGNMNAGIVILNNAQTTINEQYEGYYAVISDNREVSPETDFTAVRSVVSLSGNGSFGVIPSTRLGFALSGTYESRETVDSVSEVIETAPTFNFGLSSYKDSVILSLFKIRNSVYEDNTLVYTPVETYIGSLNSRRQTNLGESFFLETVVNNSSPNIKILVNPAISERTEWSGFNAPSSPTKSVVVADPAKALFATGVYTPTFGYETEKTIGFIQQKLDRALNLISTPETTLIDIVVDAGLSTIAASLSSEGYYNDTAYFNQSLLNNENSDPITRWRNIFNTFNNFAQNGRRDCVFIADPIRHIFVNSNIKTLSLKTNNFTTNIYNPLVNLVRGIDSNYSIMYANWVRANDILTDQQIWLPSSAFAAAAYARSDASTQPWFAPAGINRGQLGNITDIAFNPNQKQRDFLYQISLNPIVSFPGSGFVMFGQKTLQNKPSAFDRVNVRRLFLTLERATQSALRTFVFEPNTEFTRTRLRNTITPIFELAKNTQGLYDYLIVCDQRNNTPATIDNNELRVDIYLKPVKTAEFILVNFIATRTGQDFAELVG